MILGLVAASVALIALVGLIFLSWPSLENPHQPSGGTAPAQAGPGHSTPQSPVGGTALPQADRGHSTEGYDTPGAQLHTRPGTQNPPGGTAPAASDQIGPYRIEREIHPIVESWSSLTYLAVHQANGNKVILKLANATSPLAERIRVEREIYALGLPGVPQLLDSGSGDGFDYIATERIHGNDLRTYVDQNGLLPADVVLAIALQVCDSVAALHSHRWLHCDLTPANLLIDEPDRVYLIDFGLTVRFESEAAAGISGTPSFLSPEVIHQTPLVPASDIYSFGCVLYFMLTGQKPYSGNTPVEILWKQSKGSPPEFPADSQISQQMRELVLSCLSKNPTDRPQSFGELKQLFQGCN